MVFNGDRLRATILLIEQAKSLEELEEIDTRIRSYELIDPKKTYETALNNKLVQLSQLSQLKKV